MPNIKWTIILLLIFISEYAEHPHTPRFCIWKESREKGKKKVTFPDLIKSHLLSQRVRGTRTIFWTWKKEESWCKREREMREAALIYVCVCAYIYTNRHTHTHTQTSWGLFLHDPSDLPCLECLNTVLHYVPQMSIKYKKEQKTKTKKTRTRAQQQQQLK